MDQMYDTGTKQEPQQVMWIKKKTLLMRDFSYDLLSQPSASSQTVINNPVSLTPGVKGQNTCRCKH